MTAKGLMLVVTLMLAGCAGPEQRQRDALIDKIEANVRLPQGAWRLNTYARHYALNGDGSIVAVYTPGHSWPDPDWTCSELQEDFSLRDIPCDFELTGPITRAGQRRWYGDPKELPVIQDGGCGIITLRIEQTTGKTIDAFCNGGA